MVYNNVVFGKLFFPPQFPYIIPKKYLKYTLVIIRYTKNLFTNLHVASNIAS